MRHVFPFFSYFRRFLQEIAFRFFFYCSILVIKVQAIVGCLTDQDLRTSDQMIHPLLASQISEKVVPYRTHESYVYHYE
jgi:hypothetical protein